MTVNVRGWGVALISATAVYLLVSALLPAQLAANERDAARSERVGASEFVAGERTRGDEPAVTEVGATGEALAMSEPISPTTNVGDPLRSTLEAPNGTVLVGRVFDRASGAAAEASIQVHVDGDVRDSVRTGDAGRFAAGPFEAGSGELIVRPADGFATLVRVDFDGLAESVRVDVPIDTWPRIVVRVTDTAGAPAAARIDAEYAPDLALALHVVPVATRERPSGIVEGVSRSGRGAVGIGSFAPNRADTDVLGTLELREPLPAWVSLVCSQQVLATERVEPGTTEVLFTIDPSTLGGLTASLRATFIDAATREPLVVGVWIAGHGSPAAPPSGTSNERGEFVVTSVLPGKQVMTLRADGYAVVVRSIEIAPSTETDLGVFELHRPLTIAGRVRDAEGRPQALQLNCWRIDGAASDGPSRWAIQCQPDGTFAISHIVPGLWTVGMPATGPWTRLDPPPLLASPIIADARTGNVADLEVVVSAATLVTCRLTRSVESDVRIEAFDASGRLVATANVLALDRDGRLAVLPGAHELVVTSRDVELTRRTVNVNGAEQVVDLELP